MKDLGEASFIFEMKIYIDKSKRLLGLSQLMYINTVLKRFSMKNSKKGYLPIGQKNFLSKSDYPTTLQERERMSRISYASTVGSIMYAVGYKIPTAEILNGIDISAAPPGLLREPGSAANIRTAPPGLLREPGSALSINCW